MTEVPEHLLRRSRERRQAMGGEGSQSEAGAPATDAASTSVEPAAAAAPAPAGGAAAPARPAAAAEPAYTGPPPAPPRKQRVPAWAMPVLAALPLWAILYGGAFGERATDEVQGPIQQGAAVYRTNCASCHGATGGGGVGPAMGDTERTFPNFADHVQWIRTGSKPFTGQPYGATGKIATGGMPDFPDLSEAEVIAVVCHERVTLGDESPVPAQCNAGPDPDAGGADAGGGDAGAAAEH